MNSASAIFRFENVIFGYRSPSGNNILIKDFSGDFNTGEFIAIVGRNGTGKSTFLKSLVRLVPLLGGNILLKGKPVEHYSNPEYAGLVSFVSTDMPKTAGMTVKELVSLGRFPHTNWLGYLSSSDHAKVNRAIELADLGRLKDKQVFRISDGERQRAMIARALAQDTPVIVLDEPTAFLDLPNKYELAGLLSNLVSMGKTIVISTHDTSIALRFPDKLLIINDHHVSSGSPEDQIITDNFSNIFTSQSFHFDKISAELEIVKKNGIKIAVQGDDNILTIWTKKAIKRAGFIDSDTDPAMIRVSCFSLKPENKWILTYPDLSCEFHSIYDLVNYIKTNLS